MQRALRLPSVQICEDVSPVRSLQFHPKCYTALITTQKQLVLYDMLSLRLIWAVDFTSIHPHLNSQTKLCIAFTLDFNEAIILFQDNVYKLNFKQKNEEQTPPSQLSISSFKLYLHSTFMTNPTPLLLQFCEDTAILVYREVIFIQELKQSNRLSTIHHNLSLTTVHALTQLQTSNSMVALACTDRILALWRINFVTYSYSEINKSICSYPIALIALDERARRFATLSEDRREVEIFSYCSAISPLDQTLPAIQILRINNINLYKPIASMAFFSYAENTDTVGRRYRQLHLACTRTSSSQFEVFLFNAESTESPAPEQQIAMSCTSPSIYFNPLFNNCIINRSSTGQLLLTNLYGYDKEWVTLGFRFVSLDRNELYFEKEDDFEYQTQKKRNLIVREDLDDYRYSLFGDNELQHNLSKPARVKRIRFEID